MGLIITKIKKLLKGYPTVSDKYNVSGGTLEGAEVEFGAPVAYGSTTGYYVKYTGAEEQKVAGINMAKNVKLINQYPANGAIVTVKEGEAVDLFLDGFIAIELDVELPTTPAEGKTLEETIYAAIDALGIAEGDDAVVTANGKFAKATGAEGEVVYGKFTGITEYNYGKALAEIVVR